MYTFPFLTYPPVLVYFPQGAGAEFTRVIIPRGEFFLYSDIYGDFFGTILTLIGVTVQGTQGSPTWSGGIVLAVANVFDRDNLPASPTELIGEENTRMDGPRAATYDVIFLNNYKVHLYNGPGSFGGALVLVGATVHLGR